MYSIIYKEVESSEKGQQVTQTRKFMNLIPDYETLESLLDTKNNEEIIRTCRSKKVTTARKNFIKSQLPQLAFCLPNEDGSLQGSTHLGPTFGIDIDDIKSTEFDAVVKQILAHQEEAGLVMLARSACEKQKGTKQEESQIQPDAPYYIGFHAVCMRIPELTHKENVERVAKIFGVEPDKNALDPTRVFFTGPTSDIIYIDKEKAFLNYEVKMSDVRCMKDDGRSKMADVRCMKDDVKSGLQPSAVNLQPSNVNLTPSEASCMAFETVAKLCGLDPFNLDVEHFRHGNLQALLSKGLLTLVGREQVIACVAKYMPSYLNEPDCIELIDYHIQNYNADKRHMTNDLVQLNAAMQQPDPAKSAISELLLEGPPPLPVKAIENIEVLRLLLKPYDRKYWEMLCIVIPAYLAALASHYRTHYIDGYTTIAANLYVAVAALMGSGKQNVKRVYEMIFGKTLKPLQKLEFQKRKENKEERLNTATTKDKKKRYLGKMWLVSDITKSALFQAQESLGEHGMVMLNYIEASTLCNMFKQAFSNIKGYLLQAWDLDDMGALRSGEQGVEFNGQACCSCVMTATPETIFKQLFSNTSDGFVRRFFTYSYTEPYSVKTPEVHQLSAEDQTRLDTLLDELFKRNLALGDDVEFIPLPMHTEMCKRWEDEREEMDLTEVEIRCGGSIPHFMMRCGLAFTALNGGKETEHSVALSKWYGESAYYYMLKHFGQRIEEDLKRQEEIMLTGSYTPKPSSQDFDAQPAQFTRKAFYAYCVQRKPEVEKNKVHNAAKHQLQRWVDNGWIQKLNSNTFEKIR